MLKTMLNQILHGPGNEQGGPSLDAKLVEMDQHLENFKTLVQPSHLSKPRTPFDSPDLPAEEISLRNFTVGQMLKVAPVALPLLRNMQRSAKMYDGKFVPTKDTATPAFIKTLETMALEGGATDIKFVKVPPNAIFQHKGIPHEYAIVFTVEMDAEPINTSPSFDSMREVMRGYGNLARISNKLANHMRKNGFAAYPGTALGGLTDYPHLAELAGLGVIGYHGLLISPDSGARLRINTIYTNIVNLPIEAENEHLWVRDFCAMCKKCVRQCPVKAIYEEPKARGDGGMQCIDHDACRTYFLGNYGCAVCLAVCPFSQIGYDKVKARFKGNPNAPQYAIPVPVEEPVVVM